jgi:hypothetical protein
MNYFSYLFEVSNYFCYFYFGGWIGYELNYLG